MLTCLVALMQEATYRRVVEDDGKGRRKLEVGHRGFAKFLFVKITFDTHLYVWEDDNTMTVSPNACQVGKEMLHRQGSVLPIKSMSGSSCTWQQLDQRVYTTYMTGRLNLLASCIAVA